MGDPALLHLSSRADGLLYANGGEEPFHIKGANWFGAEAFNGPPRGLHKHPLRYYLDFLAAHGFNAIRLLFNHQSVLRNDIVEITGDEAAHEPSLFQLRYVDMLALLAREAARRGIAVVLACHRLAPDAWPGGGLWHDEARGFGEARVEASWGALAGALCGAWNVVGVDLQNEPHASSWGKGLAIDWNRGAERLGNYVLQKCPRWLILVEGVGYDPGAPGGDDPAAGFWWGENLVGVRTAPVVLDDPSKLVYSPHVYGPSVYQQHYFDDAAFPYNMPAVWDSHFAFAKELTHTPIVLGEFGGRYVDQDKQWQDWALPFCVESGFGMFYFALNPDSADTGGLVDANWSIPSEGTVEAAKLAALAQLPATNIFAACPQCNASTPPPLRRPAAAGAPPLLLLACVGVGAAAYVLRLVRSHLAGRAWHTSQTYRCVPPAETHGKAEAPLLPSRPRGERGAKGEKGAKGVKGWKEAKEAKEAQEARASTRPKETKESARATARPPRWGAEAKARDGSGSAAKGHGGKQPSPTAVELKPARDAARPCTWKSGGAARGEAAAEPQASARFSKLSRCDGGGARRAGEATGTAAAPRTAIKFGSSRKRA
ncbi:hypothetical protein AB1Y20_010109 [Prymnesium parvum]|uniref:Glycoside hydrolase family 5 domain-containing protein n=1 Tax=Prymnesium parvum TaxID=97485 RepID=A0AB34K6G6_PRYPA